MDIHRNYPLWCAAELEKMLHDFELQGHRLKRFKRSRDFEFDDCHPSDAEYVVICNMGRHSSRGMFRYERQLLSDYSADLIPSKASDYSIYRVTGANRDFTELRKYRNEYIKRIILEHLLTIAVFLLIGILLFIGMHILNEGMICLIFTAVYIAVCVAAFVYILKGYIKQKKICEGKARSNK